MQKTYLKGAPISTQPALIGTNTKKKGQVYSSRAGRKLISQRCARRRSMLSMAYMARAVSL